MKRHSREVLEAARPIVEAAGGTCRIEKPKGRGGHPRLIIEIGGQSRFTPVSHTPGRPADALMRKMDNVRHLIREMTADA